MADQASQKMDDMGTGTLGDRVKALRQAKGLSQEKLGAAAGVSKQAISAIENGVTKEPEAKTLDPVSRALGVSSRYLLTGRDPEPVRQDDFRQSYAERLNPSTLELAKELLVTHFAKWGQRYDFTDDPDLLVYAYAYAADITDTVTRDEFVGELTKRKEQGDVSGYGKADADAAGNGVR